jgi:hypothetical protein
MLQYGVPLLGIKGCGSKRRVKNAGNPAWQEKKNTGFSPVNRKKTQNSCIMPHISLNSGKKGLEGLTICDKEAV